MQKYYNSFTDYCKNTFQRKLYRVALDANMTCPNRDGRIDHRGCIFCDEGGSGDFAIKYTGQSLTKEDLIYNHQDADAGDYIAYFQAYTNTYRPVNELEKIYKSALKHPDIVGLSIGTRPDCVEKDKLKLISDISKDYYTWVEYGLQSVHDKTLLKINRGHNFDCFLDAYERTKERGINVCVHVIFGLWETRDEILQTAEKLAELKVDGVKIHMLCALNDTKLARLYENKEIDFMSEEEYVQLVCDFLEILPPETTVHRLAGNGLKKNLIAPRWLGAKLDCLNKIDREFIKRNSYQGSKFVYK